MKDIFISYTGIDEQIASWIAWTLEEECYDVVFQKWDFATAGRSIIGNINQAAIECERTVAVLSPDYFTSEYTTAEWEAAVKQDPAGKQGLLVPVIVRACEMKGLLDRLAYISLLNLDEEQAKNALLQALKTERAKPTSKPDYKKEGLEVHQGDKPRYPGTLPPIWNVPTRNANFTGREQILHKLHESLGKENHTALTQQALHGLGGIGKTQVAIEYAYRYSASCDLVWWINAEEESTLKTDYAELSKKLNLPEQNAAEQPVIIEAVRQWLDHNPGWLLIFDNARDSETIRNYLPQTP